MSLEYVKDIIDNAWIKSSDDSTSCKRWIAIWAGLAIIAGILAVSHKGWIASA